MHRMATDRNGPLWPFVHGPVHTAMHTALVRPGPVHGPTSTAETARYRPGPIGSKRPGIGPICPSPWIGRIFMAIRPVSCTDYRNIH